MKLPAMILLTMGAACALKACGAGPDRDVNNAPGAAPTANARNDGTPIQPDNSAVNTRDVNSDNPTAADQSEASADRAITQRIRQAVVADDSLSIGAQNVKIITIAGRVTLRGPVKSDAERTRVVGMANDVAGAANVDNQLEVKQ